MRNFNDNNRSRRPRGGRDFDRRGRRDSGRRRMHDAICADCGDNCKVPFIPSSGKPVYCSNCFEKRGNGNRNSRQDSRRPSFSNRDNRSSRDSRPARNSRPQKDYDQQFETIDAKLNKILGILIPKKEAAEIKPAAVIEEAMVKEPIVEVETQEEPVVEKAAVEEKVVPAETEAEIAAKEIIETEVEAAVEEKTVAAETEAAVEEKTV